jgi:nucleoside-diphosphate-sugar epimerase
MPILITSGGQLATLLYHALRDEHDVRVLRRKPDPAFGDACVVGDVSRYDDVARAMEGCDLVFHTAVRNNTDVELKSYEEFHTANVDGTFNVFLAALRSGVKRVVHSSTSMVLGFHGLPPSDQAVRLHDAAPRHNVDIYGLTKSAAEMHADYFRDVHNMSIISLRYGWLAPPAEYRQPEMIYNVLQFCFHEQDALAANLLVMDQQTRGNYLIGAPSPFADNDAHDLLHAPAKAIERYHPDELAYLRSVGFEPTPIPAWLDCSRAMRDLGYKPQYDFARFVQLHRDGAFG